MTTETRANRGYPTLTAVETDLNVAQSYLSDWFNVEDASVTLESGSETSLGMILDNIAEAGKQLESAQQAAEAVRDLLIGLCDHDEDAFTEQPEYRAAVDLIEELASGPSADGADRPSFADSLSWLDGDE